MTDQEFRKQYKSLVEKVAKSKGMTISEVAKEMEMNNHNNLYTMLKKGYPNGILKAIKPFEVMGAKLTIEVEMDSGDKVVLG